MAACFVSVHSIMDTPHFSGDAVHGARNRNVVYQIINFKYFLDNLMCVVIIFYIFW